MTDEDGTIDEYIRDDEIRRRMPEVDLIEDDELREETIDALSRGLPEYFWTAPATSSDWHHPYARMTHGLWMHTKMVFTAFERKVDSYTKRGVLTEHQADCARAAILLHDMLKYGYDYDDGESAASNHDNMAGLWVRENTDLPTAVVDAIRCHNGIWYDGPTPSYRDDPVSEIVHMCDMDASTPNATWGLYRPATEITDKYPNVPRAEL